MSIMDSAKLAFSRGQGRTQALWKAGCSGLRVAGESAGLGALKGAMIGAGLGAAGAVVQGGVNGEIDRRSVISGAFRGGLLGGALGAPIGLGMDLGSARAARLMTQEERGMVNAARPAPPAASSVPSVAARRGAVAGSKRQTPRRAGPASFRPAVRDSGFTLGPPPQASTNYQQPTAFTNFERTRGLNTSLNASSPRYRLWNPESTPLSSPQSGNRFRAPRTRTVSAHSPFTNTVLGVSDIPRYNMPRPMSQSAWEARMKARAAALRGAGR